jgi:amino-acid N-acetyltransferase
MMIRPARSEEVDAIISLFDDEVRAGRMLPRSPQSIRARLDDWRVAERCGEIVGCVSLVYFNAALCELRSLAVHPDCRGQGLAGDLIAAALDMARENGRRRVLALTRAVSVFERAGFKRDDVRHFPEKVWHDCAPCPFRAACDEVALIYEL